MAVRGRLVMGDGAKRNQPCACGSGKKFKKCCEGRKQVTHSVTVDFGEKTKLDAVRIGPGGQIQMMSNNKIVTPQRAWTGSHRERQKGEKSLLRVPISPEELTFGEVQALKKYNRVFCVDTNTKTINNTKLSIGCIAECRFIEYVHEPVFEYIILGAIEFHNGPEKAENFSWHLLISAVMSSPDYSENDSYGIISDSDLGEHGAYNLREAPNFLDNVLPNNFTLIYVHDKGQALSNKVLGLCDREAGKMLKKFLNESFSLDDASEVVGGICTHFRGWMNSNDRIPTKGWFNLGKVAPNSLKGR